MFFFDISIFIFLSNTHIIISPFLNPHAIIPPSFVISAQFNLLFVFKIVKHPIVGGFVLFNFKLGTSALTKSFNCSGKGIMILLNILLSPFPLPLLLLIVSTVSLLTLL